MNCFYILGLQDLAILKKICSNFGNEKPNVIRESRDTTWRQNVYGKQFRWAEVVCCKVISLLVMQYMSLSSRRLYFHTWSSFFRCDYLIINLLEIITQRNNLLLCYTCFNFDSFHYSTNALKWKINWRNYSNKFRN